MSLAMGLGLCLALEFPMTGLMKILIEKGKEKIAEKIEEHPKSEELAIEVRKDFENERQI